MAFFWLSVEGLGDEKGRLEFQAALKFEKRAGYFYAVRVRLSGR
jgi:hypothetical protein